MPFQGRGHAPPLPPAAADAPAATLRVKFWPEPSKWDDRRRRRLRTQMSLFGRGVTFWHYLVPVFPRCNNEGSHRTGKVHGKFGVASFRLDRSASLAMSIPDFIPYSAEMIHYRLTVAQNGLEDTFLVLVRREI